MGRLVNHSCQRPNLKPKVVTSNHLPRLILIAKRPLKSSEELLVDYGDTSKDSLKAHPWLTL